MLLYWPPGIWKSTIWAALAQLVWKQHIDTDAVFVSRYGDITKYIVANGELAFRQKEWEILENCLSRRGEIITLGWGTLLLLANQELANKAWNLITLMADVETIVQRITKDSLNHRPFTNAETDIRKLMSERYTHYISQKVVYLVWETESPEEIANKILLLHIR